MRTVTQAPPSLHPSWLQVEIDGVPRRVSLAVVRSVGPMPMVTAVPGAPSVVTGLVAWRGRVIVLVDVGAARARPCAVVVQSGETTCALAVDRVIGYVGAAEAEGEAVDPLAALG